jgi:hypothetical protein
MTDCKVEPTSSLYLFYGLNYNGRLPKRPELCAKANIADWIFERGKRESKRTLRFRGLSKGT